MIRLEDTTGNAVADAIAKERHRVGSPATGMVLTLLVLADESSQADAADAAGFAAQEHPMRILIVIPRKSRSGSRLDAEIGVGGDQGPGEVAKLRLHGQMADHGGFVVIPLLLSDTPVVAWWPDAAPETPAADPIGMHAQRRITTAPAAPREMAALASHMAGYSPGDTDMTWAQITNWRSLLAAALDQPYAPIIGAEVSVQKSHASGHLLAAWLHARLGVPASVIGSKGPGITSVRLLGKKDDIVLSRTDGATAHLSRPGFPPATIALPRRSTGDLLAEELRRLDADDTYGEALRVLDRVGTGRLPRAEGGVPETGS